MKPILSIVVANYNYGRFIDAALASIVDQCGGPIQGENGRTVLPLPNGTAIELIVVDGGSKDDSVDIIQKYADRISWWVSEPDRGQSDAFNKGFAQATGKYLTWHNADDLMVPGCLVEVTNAMQAHPDCAWFTGNLFRFFEDGRITEVGWGPHYLPECLQRKDSPSSIAVYGPSTFFTKGIYEQVGRIDEQLVNTMDYDLWIKFVMAGVKQRRVNCFVWAFRMHEASKSAEFGTHNVSQKVRDMISREGEIIRGRSGYHPRVVWHRVTMIWRVLDGSLLRSIYYKFHLKHMDQFMHDWRTK